MFEASFPTQWDFGSKPSDGFRNPPVADAGTVYIICYNTYDSIIVGNTSLNDMVEDVMDGYRMMGGGFDAEGATVLLRLRGALMAAATKIDDALKEGGS